LRIDCDVAIEYCLHADLCAVLEPVGLANGCKVITDDRGHDTECASDLLGVQPLAEELHHLALSMGEAHGLEACSLA